MTESATTQRLSPLGARRWILIGGAAVAVAGAAMARPLQSRVQPAALTGTAYQARVNVNLPIATSPVAARIPVPAGKRLDIERVTLVGSVLPGQTSQPVFVTVL